MQVQRKPNKIKARALNYYKRSEGASVINCVILVESSLVIGTVAAG
jgi:hypothetical protein